VSDAIAASNFGPKQPRGTPAGKRCANDAAAVGTADALQPVLADLDRKRRQLRHLMPRRRTCRLALLLAEGVAAAAALRPVLDDLRHPLEQNSDRPWPR